MKMQWKLSAAALLGISVSLVLADELVVKIGHVGPLSGAISHLGKDNENGARMAVDEINAKGVSIGGKRARFVLLTEDDAGDPK